MNLCVATNVLACGSDCLNGEIETLGSLSSSDCSSKDGFCDFSACCPACGTETGAYKECLLEDSCDMDCPAVVPTAPSPVSIFPPSEDDDFASSECATENLAYVGCVFQNLEGCSACLGEMEDDDTDGTGTVEEACAAISELCETLSCCAECIPKGKAMAVCLAASFGCDEDCADIL